MITRTNVLENQPEFLTKCTTSKQAIVNRSNVWIPKVETLESSIDEDDTRLSKKRSHDEIDISPDQKRAFSKKKMLTEKEEKPYPEELKSSEAKESEDPEELKSSEAKESEESLEEEASNVSAKIQHLSNESDNCAADSEVFSKTTDTQYNSMTKAEKKRYREKIRRNGISNAFDELSSELLKISPHIWKSADTSLQYDSVSTGSGLVQSLSRVSLINHAVCTMKRLHTENEIYKKQLLLLQSRWNIDFQDFRHRS